MPILKALEQAKHKMLSSSYRALSSWHREVGPLHHTVTERIGSLDTSERHKSTNAATLSAETNYGFSDDSYQYSTFAEKCSPLKALLVDAAGTLLEPSECVSEVYLRYGIKYGVKSSPKEIIHKFRHAYEQPWTKSLLRYSGDAREFWHNILAQSTGCHDERFADEVYHYYATAEAWRITDPMAEAVFEKLRSRGIKVAVVSNFDTRLRGIMKELGCDSWFDAITVSAEVEAEKPNPQIFHHTCEHLGVEPWQAIHVGDDRRNDVWGARDAGCHALLWRSDVDSFTEVARTMGIPVLHNVGIN